jgi:hypothetical protein
MIIYIIKIKPKTFNNRFKYQNKNLSPDIGDEDVIGQDCDAKWTHR